LTVFVAAELLPLWLNDLAGGGLLATRASSR
jgi:hypothetical protein